MKVTYVTPRYGPEVVGGAEHAARMLAERVSSQLGWQVEVLTSCATDAGTWQNELPAGKSSINGVDVTRFEAAGPRHADFLKTSQTVHANPTLADEGTQELWVDQQGPYMPELINAIQASNTDLFIFYPYLYFPTVRGLMATDKPSVMHPAAHDEIPIRMSVYAKVFAAANGFVFQTDGERRLVENLFPLASRPQITLGLGVEPQEGDSIAFRQAYGLNEDPYVICVGRVDDGKGSRLLARYFTEYKRRHSGNLKLIFVGPVMNGQSSSGDVIVTGSVSDEHKWGALRGAQALISPSAYEAFSLVLLEGWASNLPVLSNAACIATREHVMNSHGGLLFDGYLSFEAGMEHILKSQELAGALASAGAGYVKQHFDWPDLIDRYGTFLKNVASK